MTWARLDDGFPNHQKVRPLSDAAFRLHVTAICDCSRHLTDGFVIRDAVSTLQGAPTGARLQKAILELTARGLWEETESGWLIHDFLDWNPSAAEVMAKRASRAEAGARGGRRSGEERRAKQTRSKPEANASANPKQDAGKPEAKTNPVPVPVLDPDPDLKAAAEDLSGSAPVGPPPQPQPLPEGSSKVPCPAGLRLTDDQRATLETALVPAWAIDALTLEAVAGFQGDPDDHRPLAAWRKCLARAVGGRWSDPRRRRELLDARGADPPRGRPPAPWRPPPGEGEGAVPCPPELAARLRGAGYGGPLAPTGSGSS